MSPLFEFVQFEFTHSIGPPAARYLVDHDGSVRVGSREQLAHERRRVVTGVTVEHGVADVLVVGVVPAPPSRPRLRRKARDAAVDAEPSEVPLLLVTFVKGTAPIDDEAEAAQRLEALRADEDEQERRVDEGLEVLNRAIRAYRAGAHDPYVVEVGRHDPRRVRIGYGSTDDLIEGRWQAALEPPRPRRVKSSRIERLRPGEAVAMVLSGRGRVLEAEDVFLRALQDLDHGRTRAAAQQVRGAMVLFADELGPEAPTVRKAPTLDELKATAEELAGVAVERPLDGAEVEELREGDRGGGRPRRSLALRALGRLNDKTAAPGGAAALGTLRSGRESIGAGGGPG